MRLKAAYRMQLCIQKEEAMAVRMVMMKLMTVFTFSFFIADTGFKLVNTGSLYTDKVNEDWLNRTVQHGKGLSACGGGGEEN